MEYECVPHVGSAFCRRVLSFDEALHVSVLKWTERTALVTGGAPSFGHLAKARSALNEWRGTLPGRASLAVSGTVPCASSAHP